MNILKRAGLLLGLLTLLASPIFVGSTAFAADCVEDPAEPLKCFCEEVGGTLSSKDKDGSTNDVCENNETDVRNPETEGLLGSNGIIKKVLNLITWLVGGLAVIYIIIGGLKIATGGGSGDSVKSGKNMIVYALVGIAVTILSNVIINFVLGIVNNANK